MIKATISKVIEFLAEQYEELTVNHDVKPSYLKRLKKIEKERTIKIGTIDEFRRRYSK